MLEKLLISFEIQEYIYSGQEHLLNPPSLKILIYPLLFAVFSHSFYCGNNNIFIKTIRNLSFKCVRMLYDEGVIESCKREV